MSRTTDSRRTGLPGAPRRARIGGWALLRARLAGRRDRASAGPDADGYFPYTRRVAAQVGLAEARVTAALCQAVAAVDERIAATRAEVAALQGRLSTSRPADRAAATDRASSAAGVRAARTALREQAADREITASVVELERAVEQLLVRRGGAHQAARALLATHVARHDAQCATHLRAWRAGSTRRSPSVDPGEPSGPPRYAPRAPWVEAELPFPSTAAP